MAVIGVDIRKGAQLAIEERSGPLAKLGFKVELAPFDDQASPERGVENARTLVADPAVLGVVGHYNSGVQIPSSELYHAAGLCNVSPANTNPRVTERRYPEVNRLVGRDDMQGAAAAQLARDRGVRIAFVVHDQTAYGQGIAGRFQWECAARGIRVGGFVGTGERQDFAAIRHSLTTSHATCLFFSGMFDQGAELFRQARQGGFSGLCVSVDGFDSPDAARIAGPALLQGGGTFFTTIVGPAVAYPHARPFIAAFRNRFGTNPQPFAAQAYDSAALLLQAIESAAQARGGGTPSRAEVAEAVRGVRSYPGVTGAIQFDGKGDPGLARYFVIQVTASDPRDWARNPICADYELAPPP
jgi:branched-chain amino acid transport system substrate-binding protein